MRRTPVPAPAPSAERRAVLAVDAPQAFGSDRRVDRPGRGEVLP
ncbi:hypothetical protein ABZ934_31110 [Streptomyces sp. NPDC046557]